MDLGAGPCCVGIDLGGKCGDVVEVGEEVGKLEGW